MATQMTEVQKHRVEQKQLLDRYLVQLKPELKRVVPVVLARAMDPERLINICRNTWKNKPELHECTPQSVCYALLRAAELGLDVSLDLGHAYLVPFKNHGVLEATLIVGYKGYIEMAIRSGKISGAPDGDVVYEGDDFDYLKGTETYLRHRRGEEEDDKKITHSWAIVRFPDGANRFEVCTRGKIEKSRMMSKSKDKDSSPWKTHYSAMALKTAYRQLLRKLSLTPEISDLLDRDSRAEDGDVVAGQKLPSRENVLIEGSPAAITNSTTTDRLADGLGAKPEGETPTPTETTETQETAQETPQETTQEKAPPATKEERYLAICDAVKSVGATNEVLAKAIGVNIRALKDLPPDRFVAAMDWVEEQKNDRQGAEPEED